MVHSCSPGSNLFMPEDLHLRVRLRFGVFELDLRTGELRKHGLRVRLQADCYETKGIKRFRAMFRVPEHRFLFWGGEFALSSCDDWWEQDQVACRASRSLRPPRMFSMRFRL